MSAGLSYDTVTVVPPAPTSDNVTTGSTDFGRGLKLWTAALMYLVINSLYTRHNLLQYSAALQHTIHSTQAYLHNISTACCHR